MCIKRGLSLLLGYFLPLYAVAQQDSLHHKRELQEIVVAGKQERYKQDVSAIGGRMPAPLLEIPQSVQVVGRQVIKDRQAVTLNELTPLLTSVKANNGMGGFSMRGFTGYNPFDGNFILFNGVRGNLYLWSQAPLLYNIERVEVLRGPASVMFSEGMPGGIINMVTKKPQPVKRVTADVSWGSWNMARVAVDATGALTKNKKLLYRAIAGYDRSNGFRDNQFTENIFLAPSLTWLISPNTDLNIEVNHARNNAVQTYDRGTFVKKLADGSYDFDYYPAQLTVQSPDDFGRTVNTAATVTFNHQFNQRMSLAVIQRYVRSRLQFADHFAMDPLAGDSVNRHYQTWDYDQFSYQTTAYLNYRLNTGKISHQLLAGIDYNNFGWSRNDYRDAAAPRMSIFLPDYSHDVPAVNLANDYFDDNKQVTHLRGGYLQDQVSLRNNLKVLLSIRYDAYNMRQQPLSARDDLQGDTSATTAWVPRAGIVYLPVPNVSLYAGYTRSFNPQLSNAGGRGGPFPPKTATQYEVGCKGDFFTGKLSAMLAVYTISYQNLLADAPTAEKPKQQVVVPGTRSRGVEATVQGNLKDLSIIAGYAFNDHVLTTKSKIGNEGDRYVNAPRHTGNVWMKYTFSATRLKGLGIGAGGRYISNQVGNMKTQDFMIPASLVADAALSYDIRRYSFQFNLNNITNARYFNGGLSRTSVASLGNPVNFRLGVNFIII